MRAVRTQADARAVSALRQPPQRQFCSNTATARVRSHSPQPPSPERAECQRQERARDPRSSRLPRTTRRRRPRAKRRTCAGTSCIGIRKRRARRRNRRQCNRLCCSHARRSTTASSTLENTNRKLIPYTCILVNTHSTYFPLSVSNTAKQVADMNLFVVHIFFGFELVDDFTFHINTVIFESSIKSSKLFWKTRIEKIETCHLTYIDEKL